MTRHPETLSRYTSGLVPHQIVSGPSVRMDEERQYRLCSATYRLVVALSDFRSRLRPKLKQAAQKAKVEALYDR